MLLARDQRIRLARVLTWSRSNGWKHDVYPNTWRSSDGTTHVRFDTEDQTLVVDQLSLDDVPIRCRVAMIPIESPDFALDILAALGHIPMRLSAAFQPGEPDHATDEPCLDPWCVDKITGAEPDRFDGPSSFIEAGQAFADAVNGRVDAQRAAETLSSLAQNGLIVSVAYHDEVTSATASGGGAALLQDLSAIFDGDDR